ncbi:MAG: DUF3540 domain-containing protein [Hyphomicrobiales bacterium]
MLQSRIDTGQTLPLLHYARVIEPAGDDGFMALRTDFGDVAARCAASCLLQPVEGDRVLLSAGHGGNYVLAVLTRERKGPAVLRFGGDVTIHARGGTMGLECENSLAFQAEQLDIAAPKAIISVDDADIVAREVSLKTSRFEAVIGRVEQICDTLIQRLGRYFRYTAGHEEKQALSSTQLIDDTLAMTSKNTVMQSRETTRIDGENINMG